MALRLPVRDATGGFRAFRIGVLSRLPLDAVSSAGYCFQVDLVWRSAQAGFRIAEIPITFRDRTRGHSKMSGAIVVEALVKVTVWAAAQRLTRVPNPVVGIPAHPRLTRRRPLGGRSVNRTEPTAAAR